VLQEFYVQATHSRRPDRLSHEHAKAFVESFRLRFPVQSITPELVVAALEIRERFQVSYWDAAILEAARLLNCRVLLSEDLGHGQAYGPVTVENPFRLLS
jgi:predicted nucleic acid-binding protein